MENIKNLIGVSAQELATAMSVFQRANANPLSDGDYNAQLSLDNEKLELAPCVFSRVAHNVELISTLGNQNHDPNEAIYRYAGKLKYGRKETDTIDVFSWMNEAEHTVMMQHLRGELVIRAACERANKAIAKRMIETFGKITLKEACVEAGMHPNAANAWQNWRMHNARLSDIIRTMAKAGFKTNVSFTKVEGLKQDMASSIMMDTEDSNTNGTE